MATHKEHRACWADVGLGWRRGRHALRCSSREGNFSSYAVIFSDSHPESKQTCPSPGKSPSVLRGHIAADS